MKLLLFSLIPSFVNSIGDYNGYFFQDNLLQGSYHPLSSVCVPFSNILFLERFGPENGYATFNTGIPIPNYVKLKTFCAELINISQVSVCFKVYADFIRFGGQVGVMEIFRLNEPRPSMSLLCM